MPSRRTGVKLAVAETRREELEAINQRAVTDHHCVHGKGSKHSRTAASMLMMFLKEHSTT